MPLSCDCSDDHDWYYSSPDDYTTLDTKRRKRCVSCCEFIELKSICLKFYCYSIDEDSVEKPLEYLYMCETCGDLFYSLEDLGFCLNMGEDMRELVKDYHDTYGKE